MIGFDDVAGLEEQKTFLHDRFILPVLKSDLYERLIIEPEKVREHRNVLFSGPSGSGKTYLAQALASELDMDFTAVAAPETLNMYIGNGAKMIRELYERTEGIIFFDEIDAIAQQRGVRSGRDTSDVLLQLLTCIDGVETYKPYATIAATNRPDTLDDAMKSRFKELYFTFPDAQQREAIIAKHLSYHSHRIDDITGLVTATEGYDARQLRDLFVPAKVSAVKASRPYLLEDDFKIG